MSTLHERKKHHASQSVDASDTPRKRRKSRGPWGDLFGAVVAIVAFLSVGLSLAYFLLNHRHQMSIGHVFHTAAPPRFVTVLLPSVVRPSARSDRLHAIYETWGPRSRAIVVTHNLTEVPPHTPNALEATPSTPFPQYLLVPPNITVDDGVPRLNYVMRAIFEHVNPDFAFFANDHTFVIPEHVCKYLHLRNPDEDLYAGHAMKSGKTDVFNSGAAGYFLSRATMSKIVERLDRKDPQCYLDKDNSTPWLQGNPGLVTVRCLKSFGVEAFDTRAKKKYHRFHAFPITRVVTGNVDEWYKNKHDGAAERLHTDPSYDKLLPGMDCCSTDTISFHYVEKKECLALFRIRETLLEHPRLTFNEVKNMIVHEWPSDRSESGFYSHPHPKEDELEHWKNFIGVLRRISTRETRHEC